MTGWIDQHRVVTAFPAPRDSFVVTLADGKRIALNLAHEYEAALERAKRLARQTDLSVKVLPMTAREFMRFADLKSDDLASTPEAEATLKQQVTDTLRKAMIEADELSVRREAEALLAQLTATPQGPR